MRSCTVCSYEYCAHHACMGGSELKIHLVLSLLPKIKISLRCWVGCDIYIIQDMPHRSRCDRADQSARCILDLDPPAWRESNNHDCALRRSLGGGLKTHLDLGQRAEDPPGFWAAGRLPTWISGDGLQTHLYRGSGAAGVPVSRAYH